MLTSMLVVTRFVAALSAVSVMAGAANAGPTPTRLAAGVPSEAPAPGRLLRNIPQLQQKISVDATDRPVSEVLDHLSPSLQVDLSAERNVADQRITLHVANQPLYLFMGRLTRLLSHHPDTAAGYQWGSLDRIAGARPAYQLWRDGHSMSEEQNALDYPRREIAVLLRDYRNTAGMSPQELTKYKGDLPYIGANPKDDPTARAFQGLSDAQIDALVAGQPLLLDPAAYSVEIAALEKAQPGVPLAPPQLTVTPANDDWNYDYGAAAPGQYEVFLEGVDNGGMVLDTYDTNASRDPVRMALVKSAAPEKSQGPIVDLAPLLTAKTVTRDQRRDVGFTLQALAQTAHLTLYQEDFLHGSSQIEPTEDPSGIGLTTLKGPLPALLDAICAHWDYRWQKVGSDYLFWSRTWAQDRAEDVPERLLSVWRQRSRQPGGLTVDDRAEIAAALTWRQVSRTLITALPESGPWQLREYRDLRLLGQLSPVQEAAARSSDGLAFASLALWQQQSLRQSFKKELASVPDDQLNAATLTIQIGPDPRYVPPVMQISLSSPRSILMSQFCFLMPSSPTP